MIKKSDFKILSTNTVYKGWLEIKKSNVKLPNNKKQTFEYMHNNEAVMVLAVTDDNKIVTIREFRVPVNEIMHELPAGLMESDEKPIEAAKRELEEETGYVASHFELLTSIYPLVGMSDIRLHLFFASQLKKTKQHLDPAEFIDVELTPIQNYQDYLLNLGNNKEAAWLVALLIAEKKGLI